MKYSESLKKNRDFQLGFISREHRLQTDFWSMYVKKNQLGRNRIGISVSKRWEQRCAPPSGETDPGELSSA